MKRIFLFLLLACRLHASAIELPNGYEFDSFDECSTSLQPKDTQETSEAPSVHILESIPSSIAAECVNAISGDYFESHLDLVVPGPIPLFVQRSWSSADKRWHFAHMPKLKVGCSEGGNKIIAGYEGDLGSGMEFRAHKDSLKDSDPLKVSKSMFKKGLTNCAMGEISGQTNWKNSRIYSVKKEDKKRLYLVHGTRAGRVFKSVKKKGKAHGIKLGTYQLLEEHHPNGTLIAYFYTPENRLRRLTAKNQDLENLGTLLCQSPSSSKKTWRSFSGKVDYRFYDSKNRRLRFVDLSNSPNAKSHFASYLYDSKNRIVKRSLPSKRALWITYKNGKVKELKTRSSDKKIYTTHRFEYGSDNAGKFTKVYDAEGNLTLYRSKKKRLSSICRSANGSRLEEIFQWTDRGNLLSRILKLNKKTIASKEFEYDRYGNISKEILKGNLTGASDEESHVKTYRSSKDGWNLPLEENDGRTCIRLSYYPKSNLLKSRLTVSENLIVKREFFQYDINGTLIEEIIDDGASKDQEDLTGATERHCKRITPTKENPIGLPEKVEEFCLDLATGKRLHLRTTTYTYSPQGKPLEESRYDQNGELAYTLSWKYDQLGNPIEETDALGQKTFALYDSNSNKVLEEKGEILKKFTYDYLDRLIKEEEIWSDGTHLTTTHLYNQLNQKIASIDPYGNETRYVYDPFGRLVETCLPSIEISKGEWALPVEKTWYDALGNPIEKWDPLNNCTTQKNTIYGKPYLIVEPNGAVTRKEYTTDGFLSKEIAPNGVETAYTRDHLGRVVHEKTCGPDGTLLKSKSHTYNAFHLLSEIDEEGVETTYQYDPFGRLFCKRIKPQDSDEKVIEYRYDSLGRLNQTIHWIDQESARVSVQEFDLLDRVVEERIEDLNGTIFQKTAYAYDQAGNRAQVTAWSENGPSTHFTEYTPHGNPKLQIDPYGKEKHFYYTFDKYQKVHSVDSLGNQTIEVQDYRGKVIEEKSLNALGEVIREKRNDYDPCSRLTAWHTTVYKGNKPVETQIVNWCYDCMGNETACIEGVGTKDEKTTSHTYNELNQKISTLTPSGVSLAQQYDLLGRRVALCSSDETIHYTYIYDLKDRPIKTQDHVHQTENCRNYDGHGRLVQEVLDNGVLIGYAYDALDRVTSLLLPEQNRIEYHYDPSNLKKVERYKSGQLLYTHHYLEYDHLRPSLEQLPGNAGQRAHERDRVGRLTRCASAVTEEKLSYDSVSNLIFRECKDPIGRLTHSYRYDALYQLVEETGSKIHIYENDSICNRRNKDGLEYQINGLNQLTEENGRAYSYDANGCLIGLGDKQYSYDALCRLIQVEAPNGKTSYRYDAFHRRISKSVNGDPIIYLYQGQSEIGAIADGKIEQLRILGKGIAGEISGAVAFELGAETYIPLYDGSGNVAALLTLDGDPVQTYRYSAFGQLHESLGSVENPWMFSSKRLDQETGFYEFGRRYYFPEVGRWITPDPAGFEDGVNLYAYVHNSPLTHIDPDGQLAFLIPIAVNIALSVAADYVLPMAIAGLEQYYGGVVAASLLSGVVNGYNGNYSGNFGNDLSLGLCEKAGMAIGTVLSYSPSKVSANTLKKMATSELSGRGLNFAASKGARAVQWFSKNTARQSAKQVVKTSAEKTAAVAAKNGVVKRVSDVSKGGLGSTARSNGFFGKSGWELENSLYQPVRNNSTRINGRCYSSHAIDQMQNRGIVPSVVDNTILKNQKFHTNAGTTGFYDPLNKIKVIMNSETKKIVTVIRGTP